MLASLGNSYITNLYKKNKNVVVFFFFLNPVCFSCLFILSSKKVSKMGLDKAIMLATTLPTAPLYIF